MIHKQPMDVELLRTRPRHDINQIGFAGIDRNLVVPLWTDYFLVWTHTLGCVLPNKSAARRSLGYRVLGSQWDFKAQVGPMHPPPRPTFTSLYCLKWMEGTCFILAFVFGVSSISKDFHREVGKRNTQVLNLFLKKNPY
jgi:hypothetical protein